MNITLMDQFFIDWYKLKENTFHNKVHRFIKPHCKLCELHDELFKKLTNNRGKK